MRNPLKAGVTYKGLLERTNSKQNAVLKQTTLTTDWDKGTQSTQPVAKGLIARFGSRTDLIGSGRSGLFALKRAVIHTMCLYRKLTKFSIYRGGRLLSYNSISISRRPQIQSASFKFAEVSPDTARYASSMSRVLHHRNRLTVGHKPLSSVKGL